MARAFLIAGARSVVMTLWDVDDRVARQFMTRFYAELARGADRDRALQMARARLRRDGVPPREFAAFALTGVGAEPVAAIRRPPRSPIARLAWPVGSIMGVFALGWLWKSHRRGRSRDLA